MSDIFLSYASEDRERVRPLAEALMAEGWTVFWDRKIPVGKTWDAVLEEELQSARSLLIVWSKHSIKSKWVKAEGYEGLRRELPLFPVSLDEELPPLGFREIQAVDFSEWDGTTVSPLFQNLIREIKTVLCLPAATQPPESEFPTPKPAARKQEPVQPLPADRRFPEILGKTWFTLMGVALGLAMILLFSGWLLFLGPAFRQVTPPTEASKSLAPPQDPAKSPPPPQEAIKRLPSSPDDMKPFTNSVGMTLVLIPAGTFQMGSPPGEAGRSDNERQHQVTISKPFYLQTTEVTQGQWEMVMGSSPSSFNTCGKNCPVERVSWENAQEFISKLNRMENTDKYRLPTEAEWEYACRAKSTARFCFGEDEAKLRDYAWFNENADEKTHPVVQLKPNNWGLYDMHGNVWEWCQDWYGSYDSGPLVDPPGPKTGTNRMLRGGSLRSPPKDLRSALRLQRNPDFSSNSIGFRVARTF
jgi:formylglycine-generating enzyme required for sulfatase activity